MWVLKPIWAYVNAKYGSCMPGNRSKIFNVKVIHNPSNCEPLSKIGRLLTWKLFQKLESAVHWSDGYIMLIGLSLWTCWFFIFWWSLLRIVCYTAVFSVVTQRSSPLRSVAWRRPWVETAVCQHPGDTALHMRYVLVRPWVDLRVPIAVKFAIIGVGERNYWRYLLNFTSNGVVSSK